MRQWVPGSRNLRLFPAVLVKIPKGQTSARVEVPVRDDALDEPREKFLVTLSDASAPAGVTIDPDGVSATGWIDDNDDAPAAKVANAPNVTEGSSSGTQSAFTVTLSRRSGREASVNYATSDGSAKAGEERPPLSESRRTRAPRSSTTTLGRSSRSRTRG